MAYNLVCAAFRSCTSLMGADTQEIQIYPCKYADKTVHLIDTPGFDDTFRRDIDVLKTISFWLSKAYKDDLCLAGIIYLHRITDPRFGGTALKDLNMFKKLCGEDAFSAVAVATTFWEDVNPDNGEWREAELRSSPDFYGEMIRHGSQFIRHYNTETSARAIMSTMVNRGTPTVLHIQRELDSGKQLDETAAGEELQKELNEQKLEYNRQLQENQSAMQDALEVHNQRRAEELLAQQEAFQAKIIEAEKSREEMRVNMEKLFQEKEEELVKLQQKWREEHEERQRAAEEQAEELRTFQQALADAEMLAEQRRAAQEDQLRVMRKTNQKANATMAKLRENERDNQLLKENLERAQREDVRKQAELREMQAQLCEMASTHAHAPQNYMGNPPDYASVINSMHASIAENDQANRQSRFFDDATNIAVAGLTVGATAVAAAAPILCSVM